METDKLMTFKEVAARMRITIRRVRKLVRDGILVPVIKMGDRTTLVRESVVERVLRIMEGEGYGPDNRIARIQPRRPA